MYCPKCGEDNWYALPLVRGVKICRECRQCAIAILEKPLADNEVVAPVRIDARQWADAINQHVDTKKRGRKK